VAVAFDEFAMASNPRSRSRLQHAADRSNATEPQAPGTGLEASGSVLGTGKRRSAHTAWAGRGDCAACYATGRDL
jgi:hypothetical protein